MANSNTLWLMYLYCLSGAAVPALAFAWYFHFGTLGFKMIGYIIFMDKHLTQDTDPFGFSGFD